MAPTTTPSGPFTLKHASALGITRRDVENGPYVRVSHGTYLPVRDAAKAVDLVARAKAALLHCPDGSVISHHTAGRLLDLQLPADQRIHVAVPGNLHRTRRVGIASHRLSKGHEVTHRQGLPCPSILATLADLSGQLRLPDLVAAIDSALGQRLVTHEAIRQYAAGRQSPGSRNLRHATDLADGDSQSAMESKTRVLAVLGGYPPPTCQLAVRGASGQAYYLDLGFKQWKVGVEYDGRQHAESTSQYAWDQKRREDIALAGWRLVTAVSKDIYVSPAAFLDRLDATVRAAGGTPPNRKLQWSAYFGPG